nr:hypothetical protein [Tanacetum cinerariifolium]
MSSLQEDTSSIKSMMNEMYNAFRGQSSLSPSSSVTLKFYLTDTPINVKEENATHTATIEHPSHTERETDANIQDKPEEPNQSTDENIEFIGSSTHLPSITQAQLITIIHPEPSVPQREANEEIKKAEEKSKLNAISKTEVIKVVREEAKKLGIHLKEAITIKAVELFKKGEHKVLKRQHTEKVRKSLELRKQKYDSYMRTVSSRLKPEPITDIKIHPKTNPVVITIYRGTDGRNFDVHKPFFRAFGISKLDELREIIPKKKNTVVKDLMNSLSRRYERLKQIPGELGIQSALLAPEQASSQTSGRK